MASAGSFRKETHSVVDILCGIALKGAWNCPVASNITSNSIPSSVIHPVLLKLSVCTRNPNHILSFFKWTEVAIPNYRHSLQCVWTMIFLLTKSNHFKTAQCVLEKIVFKNYLYSPSVLNALVGMHNDSRVNDHIISSILILYSNSQMTYEALQVFEHMTRHGCKPDMPACTVFLSCLIKDGMTSMVWKVYKQMIKIGVEANVHIYNVLINACCKSGDVDKSDKVLNEMEVNGICPDLFTYNTLIALYCKKRMHYQALCVQDRMEKQGIQPDIVTYNSLLYGFCQEGRMKEAIKMFRNIKTAEPTIISYTTLIDGFCRVDDLDGALSLREEMEIKGLPATVVTYNAILRKMCEGGRLKDANKLLNEMDEKNIHPDTVTCNTLINAYCKIGDTSSALRVKNKMVDSGLKLSSFTYKALIHGFCKQLDLDAAKDFLVKMLDAGHCPGSCSYSWIVDGYCIKQNEEAVIRIPQEIADRGLVVDVSVYRALIRRLCKREKVNCAQLLFDRMKQKKIIGDSVICTTLAYAYWRCGKMDAVSRILDDMDKRRLMITVNLYRSLNASFASDNNILTQFWSHVADRCIMSKSILREAKTLNMKLLTWVHVRK